MSRLKNLNAYELHKHLINEYILNHSGATRLLKRDSSKDKTDLDVIRENHKFIWDEEDEADSWEKRLAKKYYDKLFKEYCICDLSRYKENKVGLRWRVEKEVVLGKGQFQCGNKACNEIESLKSWEVNFAYLEEGQKKNALVKVRLCPECSEKLNYRSKKREIKRLSKAQKKEKKNKNKDKEEKEETHSEAKVDEAPSTSVTEKDVVESHWSKDDQDAAEQKTRDEEIEEYLEELLL